MMTKWMRTIRLQPEWTKAANREISPQEMAAHMVTKLIRSRDLGIDHVDEERRRLIEEFECFTKLDDRDWDDFDELLDELYDWGDIVVEDTWPYRKVCWIDGLSGAPK